MISGLNVQSRNVLVLPYSVRIDAARNLVDDATSQAIFPSTEDAITLVAGMTYRFRAVYHLTKGGNSVTLATVFGGDATLTTIAYHTVGSIGSANTANTAQTALPIQAASTTVLAASAATQCRVKLEGELEVNAAGTLIPQVAFSGATGSTPTVAVGTWFEIWPLGINPITKSGPWA
jgi:hypothetical protein